MQYFLGIDNGGTMTKAAVFDEFGHEKACMSRNTPLIITNEGYHERDMQALWEATADCIRGAVAKANIASSAIAGIGCTGHGKGMYLWGKDNRPAYNAIASTDRRAADYVEKWRLYGTEEKARGKTLQPVIACQPPALLAWLKDNNPHVLQNTRWIFEAKDFIRFMLTGEAFAELTDYSGSGMMDLRTRAFDRDLLALFGIEEILDALPPLAKSWDICGYVTEAAAACTGLIPGTPVCGGMFDIDASAIAMNITSPEQLCVITGTWSINEYIAKTPASCEGTTRNSIFCIPEYYLIEESSATSAGNLSWYIDNFLKTGDNTHIYDDINASVAEILPGESDVLFLPFLYGTNAETCDTAAFIGLSNSHTSAHLLRAIYEGVVFSHLYHIEKLLALRETPKTIRMAGGAVNSPVWTQMFADCLSIPIEVVSTKELGALGCSMAAAVAVGAYADLASASRAMSSVSERILPIAENTAIYRRKYQKYKRLILLLDKL